MFDQVVHGNHVKTLDRKLAFREQRGVYLTTELIAHFLRQWNAGLNSFANEALLLRSRQEHSISATDIEKARSTQACFAELTTGTQIAVEVSGHFLIDSLEIEIIPAVLVCLVHKPNAFRGVHDIEKNVTAATATDHTIVANLKQEFGAVQATGPASLAVHDG